MGASSLYLKQTPSLSMTLFLLALAGRMLLMLLMLLLLLLLLYAPRSLEHFQILEFLQNPLEHVLALDDVQMSLDFWIFAREALDIGLAEPTTQSRIELAREVVVEFGQELHVEEEHRRGRQFVGDHIEENFRALVFG